MKPPIDPQNSGATALQLTPSSKPRAKTENKIQPKRLAVLVLGMHRSGTSALARILNLLGCTLPKTLIEPDASNPSGYWESLPICRLNDEILEAGGSTWHDWHQFNHDWGNTIVAESYLEKAVDIFNQEYEKSPLVLLKDPRINVLLPFWLKVLDRAGVEPRCVVIQRHPMEVASSLAKRDGFSTAKSLLVWMRYMLDAERFSRNTTRCFTSYDALLTRYKDIPSELESRLGIIWPRKSERVIGEFANFLSGGLRHHKASSISTPYIAPWASQLFEILNSWSEHGENPTDYTALDDICGNLGLAEVPFGRVVRDFDSTLRETKSLKLALDNEKSALQLNQKQLNTLQTETDDLKLKLNETTTSKAKDIEVIFEQLREEKDAHQSTKENLSAQILTAQSQNEILSLKLNELEASKFEEIKTLSEQLAIDKAAIAELRTIAERADTLRMELEDRYKLEIDMRKSDNAAAETKIKEYEKTVSSMAIELDLKQKEIKTVQNQLTEEKARAESLNKKFVSLSKTHEQELATRFQEIALLTKAYAESENNLMLNKEKNERIRESQNTYNPEVLKHSLFTATSALLKSVEKPWLSKEQILNKKIKLIKNLNLLDADWYNTVNQDVRDAGMDPVAHYILHGLAEGRDPIPVPPRIAD